MLVRVLSTTLSVLVLIISSAIPYIGLQKRDVRNSRWFCSSPNILPLFTCFACGVFLSTCFLGLLPHLNENERHIREKLNSTSPAQLAKYEMFLDSNLLILIGFLLIVLIEQSVFFCMPAPSTPPTERRNGSRRVDTDDAETRLTVQGDNQPLVRFNSSETDSDSDGASGGRIEFRTTNTNRSEFNGSHSHDHHHFIPNGSFVQSFILLFALSVHSIFEGIALGAQKSDSDFIRILIAIMLHEVLCSFAYGVKLSKNSVPLKIGLSSIFFLSITLPIGVAIISLFMNAESFTAMIAKFVLECFAFGILVYVATIEMLAEELISHHSHSPSQGLFKGLAVSFGAFVFFIFNYLIHA